MNTSKCFSHDCSSIFAFLLLWSRTSNFVMVFWLNQALVLDSIVISSSWKWNLIFTLLKSSWNYFPLRHSRNFSLEIIELGIFGSSISLNVALNNNLGTMGGDTSHSSEFIAYELITSLNQSKTCHRICLVAILFYFFHNSQLVWHTWPPFFSWWGGWFTFLIWWFIIRF